MSKLVGHPLIRTIHVATATGSNSGQTGPPNRAASFDLDPFQHDPSGGLQGGCVITMASTKVAFSSGNHALQPGVLSGNRLRKEAVNAPAEVVSREACRHTLAAPEELVHNLPIMFVGCVSC